nr:hypothetical protein [Candidatus Sigynarchaeota archaeon]
MEIKDRGKIIQVPAGYLVIAFTCKGCKLEFSSRLVEGQPI